MDSVTYRKWPKWDDMLLIAVVGYMSVDEAVSRGGDLVMAQAALAAAASLVLLARHRWALASTVLAVLAAVALGAALPLVVVLFHLASDARIVQSVVAAAVAVLGNLPMPAQYSLWAPRDPGPIILIVLPLALGMWAGSRRQLVAALANRVKRLRIERGLRAERARMAERARIAAEMHDVLAHRLSVLALHTGALQRRAEELPERVADRIDLLRATATEALDDLRDMLGVLRNPDANPASLTPSPPRLSDLLDEVRAAGQVVVAEIGGDPDGVPPSHRLAVHRIVQEGLTNVRKHGYGAPAGLGVQFGPLETTVRIVNDASGAEPGSGAGYGLIGLAERIDALRGTIEYGHRDGGWYLAARIPRPRDSEKDGR